MHADPNGAQRLLVAGPVLSSVRALLGERQVRDTSGCFYIEGIRHFIKAVECGWSIETLLYSERLLTAPVARKLVRRLKRAGVRHMRVTPEQFRSVSCAEHACGVGAILRQRFATLDEVVPQERACWIAVERIRTPGNLGTLVRTAAAMGCAGLICIGADIDPFAPAVLRASMGAAFALPLVRTTGPQLAEWTQRLGIQVIGASPEAQTPFTRVAYQRRVVLMLGEERQGLSVQQRALCAQLVSIPLLAGVDSLNVGVAGSLLLHEALRTP